MDFSDSELIKLRRVFNDLERYAARRKYKGYDPYDALLSKIPYRKMGKWPPILAIQVMKRNPVNLRRITGTPKMWNPKAVGLFLQGYSMLPQNAENEKKCRALYEKLLELRTPGITGTGWGYPFPWASPEKYLEAWSPTSVVSGFVVQGLDLYYRKYADPRALQTMEEVCRFITSELIHTVSEDGSEYKISYSTIKADFCYNASLLAAQTYALTYAHTGQNAYADTARRALQTVLSRQKDDGSWNYSESLETGRQRVQIDFHQGFILDSVLAIAEALDYYPESVEIALQKGFDFYYHNQFRHDGRALWRLPGDFPADIHHQAQGVLTATRYYRYSGSSRAAEMARSVLNYTLAHFHDPAGYFYYRKHRYFTDRTSYMRWANAWMFLALAEIIYHSEYRQRDNVSARQHPKNSQQ